MIRSCDIPANGQLVQESVGAFKFFIIRNATNAFQYSFDAQTWRDGLKNDKDQPASNTGKVFFRASNATAATVTFETSQTPLQAQDTAQSNASTFALANLGIKVGAAAAGGLPACDANGYLQITDAMALLVSGKNAGRPRQTIIFSVSSGTLNVLTPDSGGGNNYVFMSIPAGQVIPLDSDTDWILSGAGGTAKVSVGQIFLNKGA